MKCNKKQTSKSQLANSVSSKRKGNFPQPGKLGDFFNYWVDGLSCKGTRSHMPMFESKKPTGMWEEAGQNTQVPKLLQTFNMLAEPPAEQSSVLEVSKQKEITNNPPNTASQREAPKAVTVTNPSNHLCLLPFGEASKESKFSCKSVSCKHDSLLKGCLHSLKGGVSSPAEQDLKQSLLAAHNAVSGSWALQGWLNCILFGRNMGAKGTV